MGRRGKAPVELGARASCRIDRSRLAKGEHTQREALLAQDAHRESLGVLLDRALRSRRSVGLKVELRRPQEPALLYEVIARRRVRLHLGGRWLDRRSPDVRFAHARRALGPRKWAIRQRCERKRGNGIRELARRAIVGRVGVRWLARTGVLSGGLRRNRDRVGRHRPRRRDVARDERAAEQTERGARRSTSPCGASRRKAEVRRSHEQRPRSLHARRPLRMRPDLCGPQREPLRPRERACSLLSFQSAHRAALRRSAGPRVHRVGRSS